jgi:hypothetical protein
MSFLDDLPEDGSEYAMLNLLMANNGLSRVEVVKAMSVWCDQNPMSAMLPVSAVWLHQWLPK